MSKVALLVGVSKYQPGLQPLPSAIEDVRAMQRVLQHPEMGGFDEVKVLSNPITQELRIAIYNLFSERSPEDLVLFYFSGHGVKDQNRNLYLTTPETTKSSKGLVVPPTAVAASYLQTQINDSRSEHEVIILDCCYSGAIAKGLTAKDEGAVDIIAELGGKGRAILTSSTSVQSSFQQEGVLSIYTQYLVEGIETGAADLDNDGRISADELHQYASKKVQQASPAMTPQFYPVEEGYRIYLARSPQDEPQLKYRKEVERVVKEDRGEIDFITEEIDYLNRVYLNELRSDLGLSAESAKKIETEVMQPLRQRQQKLQHYEEILSEAIKRRLTLTSGDRRKLKRIQKLFQLRDEDIEPIEARFTSQPQPEAETLPEVTESVSESKPTIEEKSQLVSPPRVTTSLKVFEFDVVTVEVEVQRSGLFGWGSKVTLNINRSPSQAQYFTEDLGNGVTLDLVYIPGGKLMMGSPPDEKKSYDDERPQHEVTVPPFFMGKFQVTQAQWRAIASRKDLKVKRDLKPDPSNFKGDERPVEQVSWYDAVEFCQRLSKQTGKEYRLPTEAEWEYACRAGTTTPFHFGETITTDLANYDGNYTYASEPKGEYREQTTPVGSFPPNAFGLYDMHGNVWEWCADTWHDDYEGAPTDGSAWTEGGDDNRSPLRGGSWNYFPVNCRSAYRYDLFRVRDGIVYHVGFRVVCVGGRTR